VDRYDIRSIQRNKKLFQSYNRLRMQYAYDLNAEKASVAFEIIPVLLTLNEVDLPGYVSGGDTGCGVYGVGSSYHLKRVISDYFPEAKKRNIPYQHYLVRRSLIESLFVLGSIGTVGQTERSDFDYWVCVDYSFHPREVIEKLEEKTRLLAYWCRSTFNMDVHFFVLDLKKIRRNDFGKVDEESAGSSQKMFLKEECYRTMLLVSGKIPFWWVVPPGIGEEEYRHRWNWMCKEAPLDFPDFIDLGYLDYVSRDEFMGNALWQLSKGIKNPFKALLKMAVMEVYLSDQFEGPLLCETLKEKVLRGARSLRDLDPYLLFVETVLGFYGARRNWAYRDLMRKAFYLKASPQMTRTRVKTGVGDYKVEVFRELMANWKWPLEMVEDLNQIEHWSYVRQLRLSNEINRFFFSTYRRLSENLRLKGKQAIDDQDLTILGRKLFALFAKRKNKIKLTPFLTNKRLVLGRCVFEVETRHSRKREWVLYDASWYPTERDEKKKMIFSSESLVRTAAWVVINGLYDVHRTVVEMTPNSTKVTISDLNHLLKHLQAFFQPAFYFSNGTSLEMDLAKDRIMAAIDAEGGVRKKKRPAVMDLIYKNTWGEIFTESSTYREGLLVLKAYAQDLKTDDPTEIASRIKVHVPDSLEEIHLSKEIYTEIFRDLNLNYPVDAHRYSAFPIEF
jgi:adenylate cyclase, class 1